MAPLSARSIKNTKLSRNGTHKSENTPAKMLLTAPESESSERHRSVATPLATKAKSNPSAPAKYAEAGMATAPIMTGVNEVLMPLPAMARVTSHTPTHAKTVATTTNAKG